jgi:hypothetical protein
MQDCKLSPYPRTKSRRDGLCFLMNSSNLFSSHQLQQDIPLSGVWEPQRSSR